MYKKSCEWKEGKFVCIYVYITHRHTGEFTTYVSYPSKKIKIELVNYLHIVEQDSV